MLPLKTKKSDMKRSLSKVNRNSIGENKKAYKNGVIKIHEGRKKIAEKKPTKTRKRVIYNFDEGA